MAIVIHLACAGDSAELNSLILVHKGSLVHRRHALIFLVMVNDRFLQVQALEMHTSYFDMSNRSRVVLCFH